MKIGIITDTNMFKINESELALNGIFYNIDFFYLNLRYLRYSM